MARLPVKPVVVEPYPLCQTTVIAAPTNAGTVVTVFCDLPLYHEGPHGSGGLPVGFAKSKYAN